MRLLSPIKEGTARVGEEVESRVRDPAGVCTQKLAEETHGSKQPTVSGIISSCDPGYTPKRLAKIRVVVFVNQQARGARPISPQQVLSLVNTRSLWGGGDVNRFQGNSTAKPPREIQVYG